MEELQSRNSFCPSCFGGTLIPTGQRLICICCPYATPLPRSEKPRLMARRPSMVEDDYYPLRRPVGVLGRPGSEDAWRSEF